MRILFTAAVLFASLTGVSAQRARAPLEMLVSVGEYFDDVYAADLAEGADFVFFIGEPIRLDIQVLNVDEREHTMSSRSSTAAQAVSVIAATRNGQPTNVELSVDSLVERHEGLFRIPADWGNVRLDPRASLHWKAEFARTLPPGVYMVDFAIDTFDESSRAVAPRASRFRFEVRSPSPNAALELIRRRGMRAYFQGNYDAAEQEATALVKAHPNSLSGHILLGQIADAQGRASAATAAFQRALAIAQSGSDQFDRRHTNPGRNRDLIKFLQSRLER